MSLWERLRNVFWEPAKPTPQKRNAFAGAVQSRLTSDWTTASLAPSLELQGSLRLLRQRARDLERNNPLVRRYLHLLAENVVGHRGIRLQAKNLLPDGRPNDQANTALESGFCEWGHAATCSVDGRLDWVGLQQHVIRSIARDGEAFLRVVKPFGKAGMALQVIDPDLVDDQFNSADQASGNVIRLGVEIDAWGRAVAYHTWKRHPGDWYQGAGERVRIPASEVLHLFIPRRPNQVRGESWLAPVMLSLKMLDGYAEAELVAARTAAAKMGFITSDLDAGSTVDPDAVQAQDMEAAPGTIDRLDPGQNFVPWDPTHPSMNFPAFVTQIEKLIAGGLNVAYSSLSGDLREVNYSSIRAGLLQERDGYRSLQHWLSISLHEPVYRAWRDAAWMSGALKVRMPPQEYGDHTWQPRGWAWIDPLKDVQAAAQAVAFGFTSPQRVVGEDGEDLEEIYRELAAADALADELDVEIPLPQGVIPDVELNDAAGAGGTADAADDGGPGRNAGAGSRRFAHPRVALVRSARGPVVRE